MKKLAIATAICAPLLLGGCNLATITNAIQTVLANKQAGLEYAKASIRFGCSAIGVAETQAASEAIAVKVGRIRAGVQAVCNNVDLLTDDIIGNYVATVGKAVKDAKAAQAAR